MLRLAALARRKLRPSTYRKIKASVSSAAELLRHVGKVAQHRNKLATYCRARSGLLLNIGCGDIIARGWVNLDYNPRDGAFYFDALDPLPIQDASVRHIHCEHFLEHLTFEDARSFLHDCFRVLESGGSARIIVPDAEKYMRAYCSNDMDFFAKMEAIGNPVEPLHPKNRVCNQSFRMGGHHLFGWDFETLEHVVTNIGFSITRSRQYDIDNNLRIDGTDPWRPAESLYANLRKT